LKITTTILRNKTVNILNQFEGEIDDQSDNARLLQTQKSEVTNNKSEISRITLEIKSLDF
jgi:hypothetical protein